MKILKNKKRLFKLILTFLVVLMLSNFCISTPFVYAKESNANQQETENTESTDENASTENVDTKKSLERKAFAIGGTLLGPIVDLLLALGDGAMGIIHEAILGADVGVSIDITGNWIKILVGILVSVIAIVIFVALSGGIGALVTEVGAHWATFAAVAKTAGTIVTKVVAGVVVAGALGAYNMAVSAYSGAFLPDITYIPMFSVSPEEIFSGKLLMFDVNFFNPKTDIYIKPVGQDGILVTEYNKMDPKDQANIKAEYFYYMDDGEPVTTSKQNTALILSPTIAKWYFTIRNVVLVVMMSILVYVGIRMMLCSIASEKAKYKKMFTDWVISICLLFVLHYIMVFAVNINEGIVDLVEASIDKNKQSFVIELTSMKKKKRETFIDKIKDTELKEFLLKDGQQTDDYNNATEFSMPTNLIGRIRMIAQMQDGSPLYIGYAIAYIVLVFYTIFFVFTYLRRVIYLAFLTVIAPFVAMTYSIDKINDGKAQAFNMWLKEYIFNLLIQPLHLMLYMLLVSSAFELASENIIYTLVAIGFMMPAEKLIRSMFGFQKASTPGFLGGAVGAGLAMGAVQNFSKILGGGGKNSSKSSNNNDNENSRVRQADQGAGLAGLIGGMNARSDDDTGSPLSDSADNNENGVDANANPQNANIPPSDDMNNENNGDNGQQEFDPNAPIDFNTYEPEQYLDNPEEYNEWLELASRPDNKKSEEDNQRQAELEEKASRAKIAKANQARILNESRRRQANVGGYRGQTNYSPMQMGRIERAIYGNSDFKRRLKDTMATTAKGGVKLTGAVLGGAIGASAAIASGNPQSIPQNLTAGIAAGTTLSSGVVNKTRNIKDTYKSNKIEAEKEKYGEDYQKHVNEKIDKETFADPKLRKFYEQKFSSEFDNLSRKEKKDKMDKIMNNVLAYNRNGVQDHEIIAKTMKLEGNENDRASNENITAALIASESKEYKKVKEYNERLAKKIGQEKADRITDKANKIRKDYI